MKPVMIGIGSLGIRLLGEITLVEGGLKKDLILAIEDPKLSLLGLEKMILEIIRRENPQIPPSTIVKKRVYPKDRLLVKRRKTNTRGYPNSKNKLGRI